MLDVEQKFFDILFGCVHDYSGISVTSLLVLDEYLFVYRAARTSQAISSIQFMHQELQEDFEISFFVNYKVNIS